MSKLTTEQLDVLQFGRVLHNRPRTGGEMIHPDATVDECMQEISALEAEIERLREQVAALQASSGYEASIAQVKIERLQALNAAHQKTIEDYAVRILAADAEIKRRALDPQSGGK